MPNRPFRIILAAAWAAMAAGAASSFLVGRPIWALDAAVISVLLWGAYLARRALNLTPFLYALVVCIGVFHVAGVFGLYGRSFFGQEYDTYVHAFNSVVLGLACFRYMAKFRVRKVEAALAAVLLTLGLGLVNELVEFAGYKVGGTGDGWFLMGAGDIGKEDAYGNLMTDFSNDFFGMTAGIVLSVLWQARRDRKAARKPPDTVNVPLEPRV